MVGAPGQGVRGEEQHIGPSDVPKGVAPSGLHQQRMIKFIMIVSIGSDEFSNSWTRK